MIQKIEAKDIEIGDQIKLDAADGGVIWRRVTGWFFDGNGRVNICIGYSERYVIRRRTETVMVNRG